MELACFGLQKWSGSSNPKLAVFGRSATGLNELGFGMCSLFAIKLPSEWTPGMFAEMLVVKPDA